MADLRKLSRPGMLSYAMQRLCTWHPLRLALARRIASRRPQRALADQARVEPLVAALERDGFAALPDLFKPGQIDALLQHLEGAELTERFASRRNGFRLDAVPANVHVAEYDTALLLRSPEVLGLMHHPLLIDAATAYLGCTPTISNVAVWWSLVADGTAQEAENYHRDVDDWKFVKLFMYLTDVDEGSGPHRFVFGSHRSSRFLRLRRLQDPVVEQAFGHERCRTIVGRRGQCFLEDTFGLHKGQPPSSSHRLVLQIEYSINPVAVYDYRPTAVTPRGVGLDPYIDRLYVS